jgi:hypothetical protein
MTNSDLLFRTLVERGADVGEVSNFLAELEREREAREGKAAEGLMQLMPSSFEVEEYE